MSTRWLHPLGLTYSYWFFWISLVNFSLKATTLLWTEGHNNSSEPKASQKRPNQTKRDQIKDDNSSEGEGNKNKSGHINSVCHLYPVFWFLSVPVPLNSKGWLCVFFEIFVSDRGSMLWVKAFSSAAFMSISIVCLTTLINTVYAQWWIIQSHTSNRCQRIQNDFSWIIYYFQKSNRFVEQVIGNTDVDQGLSAGSKVYYGVLFCADY